MHALSPEARGALSQRRFLEAASVIHQETPRWFVGILEADFEHDLRGVDAVAYIQYPGEHWTERVPIQVKSSWGGLQRYKEEHAEHGAENVIVIVVTDDRTDGDLRRILYGELRKIRGENIRFSNFFTQLFVGRVSSRAEEARQRFVRAKMHRFMHRVARPHRLEAPQVQITVQKRSWWRRLLGLR